MILSSEIQKRFEEHSRLTPQREACALVVVFKGRQSLVTCENASIDDNQFRIRAEDYARAEALGQVVAVLHSHCDVGPEPSQTDRVACEASGLPWWIYSLSLSTWAELKPSGYEAPLVGREYTFGVLDCYSIIRDWYKIERGIILDDIERYDGMLEAGIDLYGQNFARFGFAKYNGPLERGDVLVMQIGGKVPNHAALYLGDDQILHHAVERLSSRDVYGGFWRKNLAYVLRWVGK